MSHQNDIIKILGPSKTCLVMGRPVWDFSGYFGPIWTYLDPWGPICTRSDPFGPEYVSNPSDYPTQGIEGS